MINQRHEKRLNKLLKAGKKNRILKYPILVLVFFEIAIFHFEMKIIKNAPKFAGCAGILLAFFVFGSFCFTDTSNDYAIVQKNDINEKSDFDYDYELISSDETLSKGESQNSKDIDINEFEEDDIESDEEIGEDTEFYDIDDLVLDDYETDYNTNNIDNFSIDDFDSSEWSLILINKQHPIPDDYSFELGELKRGMKCDSRVVPYLMAMLSDAKEQGISLVLCSPYRDNDRQVMLFEKKIKKYMKMGYSYQESYQLTSQAVTVPGASEHQVGLAFDIVTKGYSSLNEGFANTEAGIWLKENAPKYGFIIRYPEGKEDITGIEFEPWHFRYVGAPAAKYITENEITLEEFCELVEDSVK